MVQHGRGRRDRAVSAASADRPGPATSGRVSSAPCSSPSTSATRTSRSASSGPARSLATRRAATNAAGDDRRGRAAARRAAAARRDRHRRPRRDRAGLRRAGRDRRASRRSPSARAGRSLVAGAGTVPLAVRVDRPGEVGADRLVNALAAARLYGTPAVVVDFGTATTLDCVAADGAYVGGAIAPGSRARARGARGTDRQAAADRAARTGPGDRAGHGQRHAVRHGLRLPGARRRPARADPTRAGRRERRRARRCPGDPDRRPVRGAVGPRARGHRRHRPRPDAQGPGHPPRRGRRRRAARLGLA